MYTRIANAVHDELDVLNILTSNKVKQHTSYHSVDYLVWCPHTISGDYAQQHVKWGAKALVIPLILSQWAGQFQNRCIQYWNMLWAILPSPVCELMQSLFYIRPIWGSNWMCLGKILNWMEIHYILPQHWAQSQASIKLKSINLLSKWFRGKQ